MTLTFKTAKYAIDEHGGAFRIVRIVENFDDPTELSNGVVTRAEAEDIGEYDPDFKPCIVVTTAREALEAVWELAHETREIPAHTPNIFRASDTNIQVSNGEPGDLYAGHGRLRLIDPPEPEPWELSRYCHADGLFLERQKDEHGTFWRTVEKPPKHTTAQNSQHTTPAPSPSKGKKNERNPVHHNASRLRPRPHVPTRRRDRHTRPR